MKLLIVLILLHLQCLYCKDFESFFKFNSFKDNKDNKDNSNNDNDNNRYLSELTRRLDINAIDRRIASRDELISTSLKIISNVVIYFVVVKKFVKFFDETISGILKGNSSKFINIPRNISKYMMNNQTELNSYELELCNGIIDPDMIEIELSNLGGLKDIKNELLEVLEETSSYEKYSSLLNPVKGILLYGPPGCGKSALARALAKSGNVPMLSISPSLLLRKYVGETSQLTRAIFSLAFKIQPCILFIDEMDSLFRERYDDDNVVHRNLKTEFMTFWDQILNSRSLITVIGATNRPQELDPAIQRRFERSYLIGIPDLKARKEIFQIVLKQTILDKDFDFTRAAELTENYSPSDIIAVCKAACYIPYREVKSKKKKTFRRNSEQNSVIPSNLYGDNNNSTLTRPIELRPLRTSDIEDAVQNVYPTAWASKSYGELTKKSSTNEFWYDRSSDNDN